jgi:hypothetical protein
LRGGEKKGGVTREQREQKGRNRKVAVDDLERDEGRQLPGTRSREGGRWGDVIVVGRGCEKRERTGGGRNVGVDYLELYER